MRSECYCKSYSCESATKPDKRFRFEKNEENMICGGGLVHGCIESCPIRQSGEYQMKPYTKEQLGYLACQGSVSGPVATERHKKRHAKKKGGSR